MKLSLFVLVVGLGTGACVTTDDDPAARVGDRGDVADPDRDLELVVVTAVNGADVHIDLSDPLEAAREPAARSLCQRAQNLPSENVCSILCETGFAARILDGAPAGCATRTCDLGGVSVNVDACR